MSPNDEVLSSPIFTIAEPTCLIWQMKGFVTDTARSLGGLSVHIKLSHDNRHSLIHHQLSEERVEKWLEVELPGGEYRIIFTVKGNMFTELRIYDLMLESHNCSNPGLYIGHFSIDHTFALMFRYFGMNPIEYCKHIVDIESLTCSSCRSDKNGNNKFCEFSPSKHMCCCSMSFSEYS